MAATRSCRCRSGSANYHLLTGDRCLDSFAGMWIFPRFTRRRAVDLMRVAAALCS
ncbi:putative leader peptide [Streptomyces sp. NPDC002926]